MVLDDVTEIEITPTGRKEVCMIVKSYFLPKCYFPILSLLLLSSFNQCVLFRFRAMVVSTDTIGSNITQRCEHMSISSWWGSTHIIFSFDFFFIFMWYFSFDTCVMNYFAVHQSAESREFFFDDFFFLEMFACDTISSCPLSMEIQLLMWSVGVRSFQCNMTESYVKRNKISDIIIMWILDLLSSDGYQL